MDIASIPKVDSVLLIGLDFSMRPENVRYELSKGFITPAPEQWVMHKIKSLALMVYEQEKLTPLYHANVCDGRNTLAYFICAVHRQSAPQPQQKHHRHFSIRSDKSAASDVSCLSGESGKSCELPQLVTSSVLPLGYWDGLYYALLAEIRQIHGDLQDKFGWAIEEGVYPIRNTGTNGSTEQPITAVDMASMLESAWYALMDTRLVAALDDAVRMRKIRESARKQYKKAELGRDRETKDYSDYEAPPVVTGLVDANGMEAADIVEMVWNRHASEIDRACSENFVDESMQTAYRAELHTQRMNEARDLKFPSPSPRKCRCRGKCVCEMQCDIHAGRCTCASVEQWFQRTSEPDEEGYDDEQITYEPYADDNRYSEPAFGAEPTTTEMQFSDKTAGRSIFMPPRADTAMHRTHSRKIPSRYHSRQRTSTENSDLAYVPDSKLSRARGKDKYPLAFYTDGSPARYPKIRKESSSMSNESHATVASNYDTRMPTRKPVPAQSTPTQPYISPDAGYGVITPPQDDRYDPAAFTATRARGTARYDQPMRQTQDTVTQSFPTTTSNARKSASSDPFLDPPNPFEPANDYVGLLPHHPSSLERTEEVTETEPFPAFRRSNTTTPPCILTSSKPKISASTTHLQTLKSLERAKPNPDTSKPVPPLPPLPDFIAPRPATVQRYVSAGGNVPLAARPEIKGPAFHSTSFSGPASTGSGANITKAELDAKMGNPEWVRANFGDAAADALSATSPEKKKKGSTRGSVESTAVKTSSERSSREIISSGRASHEQGVAVDPRGRNSSGASNRFRRMFSRKSSTVDRD